MNFFKNLMKSKKQDPQAGPSNSTVTKPLSVSSFNDSYRLGRTVSIWQCLICIAEQRSDTIHDLEIYRIEWQLLSKTSALGFLSLSRLAKSYCFRNSLADRRLHIIFLSCCVLHALSANSITRVFSLLTPSHISLSLVRGHFLLSKRELTKNPEILSLSRSLRKRNYLLKMKLL